MIGKTKPRNHRPLWHQFIACSLHQTLSWPERIYLVCCWNTGSKHRNPSSVENDPFAKETVFLAKFESHNKTHPLKLFQTFFIWHPYILDIHVKFPLPTNHVARASCLMPHRSCGKSLVQLLDSVRAPANRSNCCVASNKFNQPTYQTDHGNQKKTTGLKYKGILEDSEDL